MITSRLDLDDEERLALIGRLRRILDDARYPDSPRWQPLKRLLFKLDPPVPQADPPSIKPGLTLRRNSPRRR